MEKKEEEEKMGSELGQVTQVAATVPAAKPGQHHLLSCAPGLADAIANFSALAKYSATLYSPFVWRQCQYARIRFHICYYCC